MEFSSVPLAIGESSEEVKVKVQVQAKAKVKAKAGDKARLR
jgi:hypothetical protein